MVVLRGRTHIDNDEEERSARAGTYFGTRDANGSNNNRKQCSVYVCRILKYFTESWAMKEANLERTERMMVRWMCGVSLKDRKRSGDLYSLLGVRNVAKVVSESRLRWFGHVHHKSEYDWVSACRNVGVAGVRCVGRRRKTWYECVKADMKGLGLHPE